MKTTFELYRCSSLLWAKLEYEDALHFRMKKAREAKEYYRILGGRVHKAIGWMYGLDYEDIVQKYRDSEDAAEWNQIFINEIEKDRHEIKI